MDGSASLWSYVPPNGIGSLIRSTITRLIRTREIEILIIIALRPPFGNLIAELFYHIISGLSTVFGAIWGFLCFTFQTRPAFAGNADVR